MQNDYENFLIVLAGPSGTGKDAVIQELLQQDDKLVRAVSVTSRERRSHEAEGVDYFFRSKEEFERMIEAGEILEYAKDYDNYYGTLKGFLPEDRRRGKDIIKVIEIKGLHQLQTLLKPREFVSIYMLPPSLQEVSRRLVTRGRDDAQAVQRRMQEVKQKIQEYAEYDYVLVNDILSQTRDEILQIINFERDRRRKYHQMQLLAEQLLAETIEA